MSTASGKLLFEPLLWFQRLRDCFAALGFSLHRYSFRRVGSGIVVPKPLLHRFSLRQWRDTLPACSAGPNDIFRHKVIIGIVNVDYVAGLRTLTMIGISDIAMVVMLHYL